MSIINLFKTFTNKNNSLKEDSYEELTEINLSNNNSTTEIGKSISRDEQDVEEPIIHVCFRNRLETDEDGDFYEDSMYMTICEDYVMLIDLNKDFIILTKNEDGTYIKQTSIETDQFKFVKLDKSNEYSVIDKKDLDLFIYDSFGDNILNELLKLEEDGDVLFDVYPNGDVYVFKFMNGLLIEHVETLLTCEFKLNV